jgi:eukaryotic-like serine/threonine-protein kinase
MGMEARMAVTELAVGASLGDGRYRLRQMLGTGGMASVWLGDDTRLRRPVAIKVLADSLALDAGYVSRFEREALVAARLSHPNLVAVFDFAGGPRPYLVMEYVPGGTLADRLRLRGREDWDPETVFRELTSALGHVHAAGIIHRDIKPANVLIGPDKRTRLTDFGVAKPPDAERLTRTGLVVGTARYIAPEVMAGRDPDERSDLYACGVLLSECLREGDPPHLRALADRLATEQPADRPASATEVLELLDRPATAPTAVIASKPSSNTDTKPTAIMARRFRSVGLPRTRAALGVGAVVLALVVLLIVLIAGGSGGGQPKPAPTVARPAATAPLNSDLDYLDRVIAQARR